MEKSYGGECEDGSGELGNFRLWENLGLRAKYYNLWVIEPGGCLFRIAEA